MPHKCTNCGRAFADGSKEMLSGCPDCGGNKFQFRPSGSSPDETEASESAESSADASATPGGTAESGAVGRAANTVKGWVGSRNRSDPAEPDHENPAQNRKQQPQDLTQKAQNHTDPAPNRNDPESTRKRTESGQTRKQTAHDQTAQKDDRSAQSSASERPDPPQKPTAESESDSQSELDSSEDRAQASARSEIVPEDELPQRSDAEETGTVIEPPEDSQPSLDELREELNSQFESIKVVEPGQYELNLMELYERDEYIIAMRENGRYVIQVPDSWTGAIDN